MIDSVLEKPRSGSMQIMWSDISFPQSYAVILGHIPIVIGRNAETKSKNNSSPHIPVSTYISYIPWEYTNLFFLSSSSSSVIAASSGGSGSSVAFIYPSYWPFSNAEKIRVGAGICSTSTSVTRIFISGEMAHGLSRAPAFSFERSGISLAPLWAH